LPSLNNLFTFFLKVLPEKGKTDAKVQKIGDIAKTPRYVNAILT